MSSHYAVLGLRRDFTPDELRRQYRLLALRYHPDRNRGDEARAAEAFKRIAEAHAALSDPHNRALYDAQLERRRVPAATVDAVFRSFGGGGAFGGRQPYSAREPHSSRAPHSTGVPHCTGAPHSGRAAHTAREAHSAGRPRPSPRGAPYSRRGYAPHDPSASTSSRHAKSCGAAPATNECQHQKQADAAQPLNWWQVVRERVASAAAVAATVAAAITTPPPPDVAAKAAFCDEDRSPVHDERSRARYAGKAAQNNYFHDAERWQREAYTPRERRPLGAGRSPSEGAAVRRHAPTMADATPHTHRRGNERSRIRKTSTGSGAAAGHADNTYVGSFGWSSMWDGLEEALAASAVDAAVEESKRTRKEQEAEEQAIAESAEQAALEASEIEEAVRLVEEAIWREQQEELELAQAVSATSATHSATRETITGPSKSRTADDASRSSTASAPSSSAPSHFSIFGRLFNGRAFSLGTGTVRAGEASNAKQSSPSAVAQRSDVRLHSVGGRVEQRPDDSSQASFTETSPWHDTQLASLMELGFTMETAQFFCDGTSPIEDVVERVMAALASK